MRSHDVIFAFNSQQQGSTERPEDAVDALRAALSVVTRKRVPYRWAAAQNTLGYALEVFGGPEGKTERLEKAVDAFRLALNVLSRESFPRQWVVTQIRLDAIFKLVGPSSR